MVHAIQALDRGQAPGKAPLATFDGHANCFVETGDHKAMSTDVLTIRQGTALPAAVDLMVAKRVSGLPVVDVDDRLVGILTSADFLSAMNLDSGVVANALETIVRKRRTRKGMGTIVDDIMTHRPITIRRDDTLEHAIQRMDHNKIKRLVVTDAENRIKGIVSRADVVKLFAMK